MIIMYLQFIITMIISMIMVITLNLMSKSGLNDREKNSPFECGFDPKNFARLPFSLHFFLIAIIFIIFDIELTLLLPIILITKISNFMILTSSISIFIMIILYGLFHENKQGALNWTK
uniref:NADH dehydrogenase subunit 3 n=1 Tax=Tomicus yunnanensis TaxID=768153 RepID=UPI002551FE8F|nr:NADH dehydrogenase subunit 3 [Tomicus yunnanensis]WGL40311.1 NADH dehydrogenase subunit 3 [Tomicus yunnanensis]